MNIKFGLAAAVGLLVVVGLVLHQGLTQVGNALRAAGWGLALVCLLHIPPLVCSSLAWRTILGRMWPQTAWVFIGARWIREAVNTLLPVAQIGGEMVGARVLTLYGASASLSGASVVVDITLEIVTQFIFTVLGLAVLAGSGQYNGTVRALAIGLVVAVPLLLGFVLAQRWGLFSLLERLIQRVAAKRPAHGVTGIAGLHEAIQEQYRDVPRVAWSSTLHLLSWVVTSVQVWVALLLMGHPASFGRAVVLFSLGHAVRSAAFLIPSGLGAQEVGFIVLGSMYGLPPEVGLALSLAIRVREIVFGVPALLVWPLLEGRRVLANHSQHQDVERPGVKHPS